MKAHYLSFAQSPSNSATPNMGWAFWGKMYVRMISPELLFIYWGGDTITARGGEGPDCSFFWLLRLLLAFWFLFLPPSHCFVACGFCKIASYIALLSLRLFSVPCLEKAEIGARRDADGQSTSRA